MTATTAIEHLEASFAALLGAPGAVATGFGRGAIYLALEAIGVGGADVLVPDLICAQVLEAIRLAGARPVFYPVPLDLAVQPDTLTTAVTRDTHAAIVVHYFGMPQPNVSEMCSACRRQGIAVIEDCSLALLARTPAGLCGTFGDYATFSFTKNNWCYGGGMALARKPEAVHRMRHIRERQFTADDAFCEAYGRLREMDFEANRPSRSQQAAQRGLEMQRAIAAQDPRFEGANFFDAAGCTIQMSANAATRALEILHLDHAIGRKKREFWQLLCEPLFGAMGRRSEKGQPVGLQTVAARHCNGSFLVLHSRNGMGSLIERAAIQWVTLRHSWPAYQPNVPRTIHADRMGILEIHPDLTSSEIERIASVLESWEP